MTSDPIADLLTRVMNGHRARHANVHAPYSRLKEAICGVLRHEGYIRDFEKTTVSGHPALLVTLAYDAARKPAILGVRRVSRPGRRVYVGADELPQVRSGLGVAVLTTPKGVMSDGEARKQRLGGELLCEIW
ncbi:MAG: 30S ribosomal protein S8 [Deltaproteobacteria bacterium]|nr:30S ribosomal protein S8 [Deltaproteobacteria bacterium]